MELATVKEDLPQDIKEKVIEELKEKKFVLDDKKPIGKGSFSFVYRTRSTVTKELGACKVIMIQESLSLKAKEDLTNSIQKKVILSD